MKNIAAIFVTTDWQKNDMLRVMTAFRHIIEGEKKQSTYPYLNLYASWVVHPEISDSITALKILELLTDAIIAHNENSSVGKWINDVIIDALSFHKLKTDIENLCDELSIKRDILGEHANWKKFVQFLVTYELQRKPIKFPQRMKPKTKKIFDSIHNKVSKTSSKIGAVLGLSFLDYKNTLCWKIDTEWTIQKGVTLMGPIGVL